MKMSLLFQNPFEENNMNTEIGDTISLTLGSRIWDEYNAQLSGLTNYRGEEESFVPAKEKTYVIVGILSDVNDSKLQQTIMPLQVLTKRHPIFCVCQGKEFIQFNLYRSQRSGSGSRQSCSKVSF